MGIISNIKALSGLGIFCDVTRSVRFGHHQVTGVTGPEIRSACAHHLRMISLPFPLSFLLFRLANRNHCVYSSRAAAPTPFTLLRFLPIPLHSYHPIPPYLFYLFPPELTHALRAPLSQRLSAFVQLSVASTVETMWVFLEGCARERCAFRACIRVNEWELDVASWGAR